MKRLRNSDYVLLAYIEQHIIEHQRPPTIAEMAAHMGYRCNSPAQNALSKLREHGLIDVTEGRSRSVAIKGKALKWVDVA